MKGIEVKNLPVVVEDNVYMTIQSPKKRMEYATEVAESCRKLVTECSSVIKNKKYPMVECWQTIANAHMCVLGIESVKKTDDGYVAIGSVRRISDGSILCTAEGFVGNDENTWKNRQEYAKRAMAQTRAMSRAGRSAFAYVVTLLGKEFSTTPAEEMPDGNGKGKADPPKTKAEKTLLATKEKISDMIMEMAGGDVEEAKRRLSNITMNGAGEGITSAKELTVQTAPKALSLVLVAHKNWKSINDQKAPPGDDTEDSTAGEPEI